MEITAAQCAVQSAAQGNALCSSQEPAPRSASVAREFALGRELALGVERAFHRARLALARAL